MLRFVASSLRSSSVAVFVASLLAPDTFFVASLLKLTFVSPLLARRLLHRVVSTLPPNWSSTWGASRPSAFTLLSTVAPAPVYSNDLEEAPAASRGKEGLTKELMRWLCENEVRGRECFEGEKLRRAILHEISTSVSGTCVRTELLLTSQSFLAPRFARCCRFLVVDDVQVGVVVPLK